MRLKSLLLAILALLLIAPVVSAQDAGLPRFEADECQFTVPDGTPITCGFVVVPEDHFDPSNTNTVRVAVAIVEGEEDGPADPILLLSGGPGEKTINTAAQASAIFGGVNTGGRDLILFDQRGVGLSEPALECPEFTEAYLENLTEPDPGAAAERLYAGITACGGRLADEGYNLNAFNTLQNAADVDAIRAALGYEQVNLLGVSYGSELAQRVMEDYPAGIRSVAIDSVLPLDESFYVNAARTVVNALDRLLAACAADDACNTAYPDLRETLFQVIDQYNAEPVMVELTNPLSGEQVNYLMTGDNLTSTLSILLYQASLLPQLPRAISDVAAGDLSLMTQLAGLVLVAPDLLSRGMQFSVFCADDLIGRTEQDFLNVYDSLPPQYAGQLDIEVALETGPLAICADWPVEQLDEAVLEPIQSDIPTLVLSGEFDPVTPPEYADRVAEGLTNHYRYTIPSIGHSANVSSECARTITASFFEDPASQPDDACLAALGPVPFVLPLTDDLTITMTAFTNEQMGIQGVYPEGWTDVQPGQGIYLNPANGNIGLFVQAGPTTPEDLQGFLAEQFGLEGWPEATETRVVNDREWDIFDVTILNQPARVAMTRVDDLTLSVILLAPAGDFEVLLPQVFDPALEAVESLE
jgi:pimeloyl-ACP methyl ester carboxylesterase